MIRMRKRLEGERKFELCFPNTLLLRPPMWMRRAEWIDRKTVANSADCFPASWVVIDWTLHSSLRSPNLFFLCCDKHHYQKQLGKQSLFSLYIPGHSLSLIEVRAGTQNRNLETGTQAEESAYWLCLCITFSQLSFLYTLAPPAQGWHPSTLCWYFLH